MPQKISIRGIIGFDVTAQDIREQFKTAAGEDVILEINSPGGDLLDGIDIYNQIKQYEGKVTAHIFGMAASAASYLAVAADSIRAEDNSVFMIHNAWLIAIGDYKEMQKVGELLDSFSGVIARGYAAKTGKPLAEIRELMDAETYFFGDEIRKAGFADSIEKAGDGAENKAQAFAIAGQSFKAMKEKLESQKKSADFEKISALVTLTDQVTPRIPEISQAKAEVKPSQPAKNATLIQEEPERQEVNAMTLEQLKKEHPDVFAEVVAIGEAKGAEQEKARIKDLWAWVEAQPENPDILKSVSAALVEGKTANEILPKLITFSKNAQALDGENPPSVQTQGRTNEAPASEDEKAVMAMLGVTLEQLRNAPQPEVGK